MRAHQCERELLSDHATLARLAAEVGLPATEVTEVLASDRFAEEVRDDEALAPSWASEPSVFVSTGASASAVRSLPTSSSR